MAINMNNHAFKGHRTLLGTKYVTYGELELPLRYDLFALSKNGFDWGHTGLSAQQLAFSILYQLTNEEFAKNYAPQFTSEIVAKFNNRDWVITGFDVLKWINKNTQQAEPEKKVQEVKDASEKSAKKPKLKSNVVKEVCDELQITQKQLANILEIPEGTVSSWAVKNEIPRLGKKAIEFYTQSRKNQKIVDSYKSFVKLLNIS